MTTQRVVIKIGTSTLTAGTKSLSMPHIINLVRQIAQIQSDGHQVLLVSSGAMAVGLEVLDFPELPKFIPTKQMLAAIGQPRLIAIYDQLFGLYEKNVAQVLLTRFDISDRRRYLNARNTLEALLAQGVIPVINENDTVATEEIRVGDNDNLSALVCNLIEADLLMMLTNQEGMFTANPDRHEHAKLIPEITDPNIPDELWQAAGKAGNHGGTGGMYTKLQAADLARRSGSKVVIAHGALPDVVSRVVSGETIGTRFSPLVSNMESRKRFILAGPKPAGELVIDAGATNALVKGKNSLLPVGVMDITGNFERGETVRVKDGDDREVAVGLANYSSESMRKLCGKQSVEIENILGYTYGKELIHRDNMILL